MSKISIEGNASGTGTLTIAAPNTNSNYTLTLPTESGTVLTNNGNQAGTFSTLTVNSNNISADNSLGFRNRIINGDMRIDQRNAGASVTPNGSYTLDRWAIINSQTSKLTVQQSSTAPTGFSNSLLVTSSSAYSVAAGDYFALAQYIEGFNFADASFGTADAKTITISFWVRSSLTGTFGGAIKNAASNRSYPFTYTISSADTFEYKTITIAGDTTGTWVGATNGTGLIVQFGLGAGSTFSGTAGAWAGSNLVSATGATSVVGTNGATFYITGVQLEVGSVATPFERRPYGTELSLCQRYYQGNLTSGGTGTAGNLIIRGQTTGTGNYYQWVPFSVQMRAAPTMNVGTPSYTNSNSAGFYNSTASGAEVNINVTSGGGYAFIPWRAEIEL